MTDHEAFVNTLREPKCPKEAFLVYADFLEENGETARSEYIRVSIEAARPCRPIFRPLAAPQSFRLPVDRYGIFAFTVTNDQLRQLAGDFALPPQSLQRRTYHSDLVLCDVEGYGTAHLIECTVQGPTFEEVRRGYPHHVVANTAQSWVVVRMIGDPIDPNRPLVDAALKRISEIRPKDHEGTGRFHGIPIYPGSPPETNVINTTTWFIGHQPEVFMELYGCLIGLSASGPWCQQHLGRVCREHPIRTVQITSDCPTLTMPVAGVELRFTANRPSVSQTISLMDIWR